MPNRDLDGLMRLWTVTLPKPEHVRAFAEHYTDPVVVNGTPDRSRRRSVTSRRPAS
jgi:hypothetical protein